MRAVRVANTKSIIISDTTGIINRIPDCEGMAMMRLRNGTYYLITSHKTGWSPNPLIAWRSTTTSLDTAKWLNLGIVAPGSKSVRAALLKSCLL